MKFRTLTLIIALIAVAFVSAEAGKIDKLLKKNAEARGTAAFENIKTWKVEGNMQVMGQTVPFTLIGMNPGKFRFEQEAMGQKIIVASNGDQGWIDRGGKKMLIPHQGAEQQINQFSFLKSPLKDYNKEEDGELKLIGRETIDGKEAYKLKISKEGQDITFFMGKDNHIIFKILLNVEVQGQMQDITLDFEDFKKVEGILVPHKATIGVGGMSQVINYTKVIPGFEVDPSTFEPPADAKPMTQGGMGQ